MIRSLLLSFCQWCNNSWWGHGIRDSTWLFPFVEIFHLLGLGILGGAVLMLNLRLMRLAFKSESTAELAGEVDAVDAGQLGGDARSGFLLFSTEAVKMYGNWAFQFKMLFLLLAAIYTFTIHRKVTLGDDGQRFGPAVGCCRDCVAVVVVRRGARGPRAWLCDDVGRFGERVCCGKAATKAGPMFLTHLTLQGLPEAIPVNPIARWVWCFRSSESIHICGFTLLVGTVTCWTCVWLVSAFASRRYRKWQKIWLPGPTRES